MSSTRKVLLILSVLVGLFGLLRISSLLGSSYADAHARDNEQTRAELSALESGQPTAGELNPKQRADRIELLRGRLESAEETAAFEREFRRGLWIKSILTLLVAGALGSTVVVMGRPNKPRVLARLDQARPGVVVALVTGVLASVLLVGFSTSLFDYQHEVTRSEREVTELQHKLRSFKYDANGNVSEDQRIEFAITVGSARAAPAGLAQARGQRTMMALLVLGSLLALGLSVFFGRRSWARSFSPATT